MKDNKYINLYIKLDFLNYEFIHLIGTNNNVNENNYKILYRSPSIFLDGIYLILMNINISSIMLFQNTTNKIILKLNNITNCNYINLFHSIIKRLNYNLQKNDSLYYIDFKNKSKENDIIININTEQHCKLKDLLTTNIELNLKISIKNIILVDKKYILDILLEDFNY